jgi:colicin import membrane protein
MTQKVRKWLKRRGLRGGSSLGTPVPDEAAAAKAAAEKAAAEKAAADEAADEAAVKEAAAQEAAAKAAANNVVVKSPNDSNTSNDTLVPDADADADAINNRVVKKLGDEPEEMSASSDKQAIFKDALLKAQEAVNKALTAYP